jgi:hypothetical protein
LGRIPAPDHLQDRETYSRANAVLRAPVEAVALSALSAGNAPLHGKQQRPPSRRVQQCVPSPAVGGKAATLGVPVTRDLLQVFQGTALDLRTH